MQQNILCHQFRWFLQVSKLYRNWDQVTIYYVYIHHVTSVPKWFWNTVYRSAKSCCHIGFILIISITIKIHIKAINFRVGFFVCFNIRPWIDTKFESHNVFFLMIILDHFSCFIMNVSICNICNNDFSWCTCIFRMHIFILRIRVLYCHLYTCFKGIPLNTSLITRVKGLKALASCSKLNVQQYISPYMNIITDNASGALNTHPSWDNTLSKVVVF